MVEQIKEVRHGLVLDLQPFQDKFGIMIGENAIAPCQTHKAYVHLPLAGSGMCVLVIDF